MRAVLLGAIHDFGNLDSYFQLAHSECDFNHETALVRLRVEARVGLAAPKLAQSPGAEVVCCGEL
jgi:hypothetical protein